METFWIITVAVELLVLGALWFSVGRPGSNYSRDAVAVVIFWAFVVAFGLFDLGAGIVRFLMADGR